MVRTLTLATRGDGFSSADRTSRSAGRSVHSAGPDVPQCGTLGTQCGTGRPTVRDARVHSAGPDVPQCGTLGYTVRDRTSRSARRSVHSAGPDVTQCGTLGYTVCDGQSRSAGRSVTRCVTRRTGIFARQPALVQFASEVSLRSSPEVGPLRGLAKADHGDVPKLHDYAVGTRDPARRLKRGDR
jgi:hypothetical protein